MATSNQKLKITCVAEDKASGVFTKVSKSISKVGKTSGLANNAVLNLTRGINDAKFGFAGLANNLEFVVESFGQLKKNAGGLKGAMAALGKSVMGPIGIAAGISLLIGYGPQLYTFFKEKLTGQVVKSESEVKKLNDRLRELLKLQRSLFGQFSDSEVEGFRQALLGFGSDPNKIGGYLTDLVFKREELSKRVKRDQEIAQEYERKGKTMDEAQLERMNKRANKLKELTTLITRFENKLDTLAQAQDRYNKKANEGPFKNKNAKDPAAGLGFLTGGGGLGLAGLLGTPGLFKGKGAFGQDYTNPFQKLAESADFNKKKITGATEEITESFDAAQMMLGGFMASLDDLSTGNFEGFAKSMISTAKQIAMAMAITAATKDGAKLGAIALPALIAMALGAVGSAFGRVGAGGGGSTGSSSTGFTRDTGVAANLASNVTGSNINAGAMVIRGSDLVYVTNKAAGQRYAFGGRG